MNAAEYIESPMLGRSRIPQDDERDKIAALITTMPVAVFQELNKAMNARGLMLAIDVKENAH